MIRKTVVFYLALVYLIVLCTLIPISTCNDSPYSRIRFVGKYDKLIISGDDVNWYEISSGSAIFDSNSLGKSGCGLYTIRFLRDGTWYQKKICVYRGENTVDIDKFTVKNFGVDYREIEKASSKCKDGMCYGYIYGDNVSISVEDLKKLLSKRYQYYVVLKTNKDKIMSSINDVRNYNNRSDNIVLAISHMEHWVNGSKSDVGSVIAHVYNKDGVKLFSVSGDDVMSVVKKVEDKIKGNIDIPGIGEIDLSTIILVLLAIVIVYLFLKK